MPRPTVAGISGFNLRKLPAVEHLLVVCDEETLHFAPMLDGPGITIIPEPSTLVLRLLGLAGLARPRRSAPRA